MLSALLHASGRRGGRYYIRRRIWSPVPIIGKYRKLWEDIVWEFVRIAANKKSSITPRQQLTTGFQKAAVKSGKGGEVLILIQCKRCKSICELAEDYASVICLGGCEKRPFDDTEYFINQVTGSAIDYYEFCKAGEQD